MIAFSKKYLFFNWSINSTELIFKNFLSVKNFKFFDLISLPVLSLKLEGLFITISSLNLL